MKDRQKGYTLTELVMVIVGLFNLCIILAAVYAAAHFIAKFW